MYYFVEKSDIQEDWLSEAGTKHLKDQKKKKTHERIVFTDIVMTSFTQRQIFPLSPSLSQKDCFLQVTLTLPADRLIAKDQCLAAHGVLTHDCHSLPVQSDLKKRQTNDQHAYSHRTKSTCRHNTHTHTHTHTRSIRQSASFSLLLLSDLLSSLYWPWDPLSSLESTPVSI